MSGIINLCRSFALDRKGIAAIEYALIAAFMAIALVASVPLLTASIKTGFTLIAGHVSTGT